MALRSKDCTIDVPCDAGRVFEAMPGVVQGLGWTLKESDGSPGTLCASTPSTYPKSYGEQVKIVVTAVDTGHCQVAMTSTINPPMALDTFKVNRANVERFQAAVGDAFAG